MQKIRSHEWDVGIQGCRINGGRINEGRLYLDIHVGGYHRITYMPAKMAWYR